MDGELLLLKFGSYPRSNTNFSIFDINASLDTGRQPTVKTAAHLMRRLIYNNKDQLQAGVIVAGWDPVNGGSVYTITLGGSCLELPFATGGSGSIFIAGLLDSEFRLLKWSMEWQTWRMVSWLVVPF